MILNELHANIKFLIEKGFGDKYVNILSKDEEGEIIRSDFIHIEYEVTTDTIDIEV